MENRVLIIAGVQIVFIAIFLLSISCENQESYYDNDPQIVVDGWVIAGEKPNILLTYSMPYIIDADSSNIRDFALTKAKVTLKTDQFEEILVLNNSSIYFPPYVYEPLVRTGVNGQTYDIEIFVDGKTARSTTYVPDNPIIYDTKFIPNEDSVSGHIELTLYDPPDEHNYYRILTKRIGQDKIFYPIRAANIDDITFTDTIATIPVFKGPGSNLMPDSEIYFNTTDLIVLRVLSMTKSTYNFWTSVQVNQNVASNPLLSSYQQIESNIEGGLGIWAGYGMAQKIIIPSNELE